MASLSLLLFYLLCLLCLSSRPASAGVIDPQFILQPIYTNIPTPTKIKFAPDGRVFVTSKSGVIYTADSTATPLVVAADISQVVFNNFDRGLLSIALHPNFATTTPHVYLLLSVDATITGTPPVWNDKCDSGVCVGSSAIGRMIWHPDTKTLTDFEYVLRDWCIASTTHSIGDLAFDANGNLL